MLDGLGHTRLLLDSSGNITDRYSYDAWGNPIEQVGTTFNPFRWNAAYGYEWTPAIGLYHVGAREYDPRTARWLQRDPIDAASGDPNLYRYAGNDPVNRADPSGLDGLDDAAHFAAGWGDRLTGNLTKHIRDWLCDRLDLPRWEPRDPCDEWYLAGHLVGAVHDYALTRGAGKAGGALRAARQQGKNPPNPGGRHGGSDHRNKVMQRAQDLQNDGYTIVAGGGIAPEQAIRDPNNPRRLRYPDIIAEKGGQRHYENVGRRNKRGDPVKRERQAKDDLEQWLGVPVQFTPYN